MKNFILPLVCCTLFAACNNDSTTSSSSNEDSNSTANLSNANHNNHEGSFADSSGTTSFTEVDREFVLRAGMGNTAEVETGTLAQQKGNAAGVKQFGAQMILDHKDAQMKLKTAVGSGMAVPDSVDKKHADLKKKLQVLRGAAFDKEYITSQINDHQETIALFEREISGGSNSALMEFARATLPHLKMHLEKVQLLSNNPNP